ncbi:MmgE/PrpD family protein [Nocardia alni]|uniref:MmgE/PrpD family protein n=1 Tax=Nocardia alni TaxID=2815723 RepID=UPI001C2356C0|nr:MmgE/PrpD family protein [Nocardia alni]
MSSDGRKLAHLAGSAAQLTYGQLPIEVVETVRHCVLDTLGVALAGMSEPATRVVRRTMVRSEETGSARLWGTPRTTSAATAAIVNGTAAHALDFDDWAPGSGIHPSAPLVPALIAVGEEIGCSGADLISAYVAGYELQERLGLAINPSHYGRGFHTTGTVGTFGAAAAVAHLLGANAEQMAVALRIAATMAAGLKAMFGSMGKPLHAGRAAQGGIHAARLAMNGFVAREDAVFGPQGFVATQSSGLDEACILTGFGAPWHVLDARIKQHAACFGTHAAIEAALRVRADAGFDVRTVRSIELDIPSICVGVCTIAEPTTVLESKFSIAFATALALVHGRAGAEQFTEETLVNPAVTELSRLVRLRSDDHLAKTGTRMRIVFDDGSEASVSADSGERLWRVSPSEQDDRVRAKFLSLATPVLSRSRAEEIADRIAALQDCPDIAELTREWKS